MATPQLPPDKTPDGWGNVAVPYDQEVAPFLSNYAQDALRLTDLKPGERVLDVAAGSGGLSFLAAERGARVLATDFAPGMVERLRARAKERKLPVEAEVMDGQALAVPDDAFDAAYSNFGLIFFPDRAKGFRELRRALRPGGRAAVTAWSRMERMEWVALFAAALKEAAPDLPPPPVPPAVFSLADRDQLAREMREAGFRDVRVETVAHTWVMDTPEHAWSVLTRTNPVMPMLMQNLGADRIDKLREVVDRRLRERATRDGIPMLGEAHVGLGVK